MSGWYACIQCVSVFSGILLRSSYRPRTGACARSGAFTLCGSFRTTYISRCAVSCEPPHAAQCSPKLRRATDRQNWSINSSMRSLHGAYAISPVSCMGGQADRCAKVWSGNTHPRCNVYAVKHCNMYKVYDTKTFLDGIFFLM